MADERTRSDYRLTIPSDLPPTTPGLVALSAAPRVGLAELMLAAYQGTIDDEGETLDEALEAIDYYCANCLDDHSFVLIEAERPVAMSLVLIGHQELHYIDPVAVADSHKRQGLGLQLVQACLASLAATGVTEVGATITDGNVASERLFASLGSQRVGPWPPVS